MSSSLRGARLHSCNLHSQSLFPIYRCQLEWEASSSGMDRPAQFALKIVEPPEMAKAEYEGLQALAKTKALVPAVFGTLTEEKRAALAMEFIAPERSSPGDLFKSLLCLYGKEEKYYGWPRSNFIGRLVQPNQKYSCFSDYWIESRIRPQLDLAQKGGRLSAREASRVLHHTSDAIRRYSLDAHPPALIHGDLWSGNVLGGYLIDPAVSYGNPEQDLAMLCLFGSPLSIRRMDELLEELGRPSGFSERIRFWQVYPLLVHTNLFGGSYARQLMSACS